MNARPILVALTSLGLLACTGADPKPDSNPSVETPKESPTEGATSEKGIAKEAAGEKRGDESSDTGQGSSDAKVLSAATQIWVGLGVTSNSCPNVYDYWPNGGLLITACHLVSVSQESGNNLQIGAFEALSRLSPVPVFLSGPHKDGFLLGEDATSDDFGRYNPAFVDWFVANAIPGADDADLRDLTKRYYDQNLREIANTYEVVYQAARSDDECFIRERELYLDAIDSGTASYYYERWYAYLSPGFCGNPEANNWNDMNEQYDGNVVKSAMGFWVRRSADGTMEQWHDGLEKLRATYAN